jgi:hypothetical protein
MSVIATVVLVTVLYQTRERDVTQRFGYCVAMIKLPKWRFRKCRVPLLQEMVILSPFTVCMSCQASSEFRLSAHPLF